MAFLGYIINVKMTTATIKRIAILILFVYFCQLHIFKLSLIIVGHFGGIQLVGHHRVLVDKNQTLRSGTNESPGPNVAVLASIT